MVVTNQSGIARGFFTEAFVEATHRHISALLAAGGARIDAYYYCPHHPGGTVAPLRAACDCRKPARGLVDRAVPSSASTRRGRSSSATGGSTCGSARAVGARAMLVRTGYGAARKRGRRPVWRPMRWWTISPPPRAGFCSDRNLNRNLNLNLKSAMLIARSVHPLPGEAERKERLLALVDGFSSRRVLVVGDLIADEFIYGEVARVSREAPVLILKYDATEMVAGGAGNAANNVAALGGRARLAGPGRRRRGRPPAAGELSPRRGPRGRSCARASTARRSRRGFSPAAFTAANQQVVRIDRETGWPLDEAVSAALAKKLEPALDGLRRRAAVRLRFRPRHAGAGRHDSARAVAARLAGGRSRCCSTRATGCSTTAGLTACTPNESEVEQVLGIRIDDDAEALERAGRLLLRRTRMQAVLITRGSRGMALFQPRQPTVHVPIFGSDEVADVTGAGDTVIATFGLALAAGASFYEARAPRQLRRRPRRDEARHRDRFAAGACRRRRERSRHVAGDWSQEGPRRDVSD